MDRSGLPEGFIMAERHKSNLILESNLLKVQELYWPAAEKFAAAAEIEGSRKW
jgi:hypothetical protein